jgi:hypothetical protein
MKAGYLTLAALTLTLTLGGITQNLQADSLFDLRSGKADNGMSVVGRKQFSLTNNGITATFTARNGVFVRNGVNKPSLAGIAVKSVGKDGRPHRLNSRKNGREVILVRFSQPITLDVVKLLSFKNTNLTRAGLSFTGALAGPTSIPASSPNVNLSAYGATSALRLVFNHRNNGIRLVSLSSIADPNGGGDDGDDDDNGGDDDDDDNGNGGGDGDPTVIPLPTSAWTGLTFLAALGTIYVVRRRRLANA